MTKNNNCPKCDAPLQADAPKDASPECLPTAGIQSAPNGDTPRHGATTKSERSRLALWGLLLPFLAVGLSIPAAFLMTVIRGAGGGGSWSYLAATVPTLAALAVLTGTVFSIVALVKIQRSNGKLHGRWMAIVGVLVPMLICVPVSGLVLFAAVPVPVQESDSPVPEVVEETGAIDSARHFELVDEASVDLEVPTGTRAGTPMHIDIRGRESDEAGEAGGARQGDGKATGTRDNRA
jgi:hypothetical protein